MKMKKHSDWAQLAASFITILAIIIFISTLSAAAQQAGGTILGVVTDPTSGGVSGGTVTIKNSGTGVERTVQTNGDGLYAAPNLIPGTYEVSIAAAGFTSAV